MTDQELLVQEIARELYDRFVMGGWEPQDAYPQIREWLSRSETIPRCTPELPIPDELVGGPVHPILANYIAWRIMDARHSSEAEAFGDKLLTYLIEGKKV